VEEALARAQLRGLDVILINENADPPLVRIADVGKYAFMDKKRQKEKTKNAKAPKVKDVKISYTIGEHDLDTRIRQMEKWMENGKQQVRVTVVMKGRARMFEKQARQLMKRVQLETASFSKTMRSSKNDDGIRKTPRGDLTITLQGGADIQMLKELAEVGLKEDDDDDADEDEADEDEDDDGDDSDDGDLDPEVAEILEEMKEVKDDLLDCGIKPGQLTQQPEMKELEQRLKEARARVASAVHQRIAPSVNKPMIASFVVLPALLVGVLQPRRRPRWFTRAAM